MKRFKTKILLVLLFAGVVFIAYDMNNAREVNALPFNKELEKIAIDND